jgi:hypothetical protein
MPGAHRDGLEERMETISRPLVAAAVAGPLAAGAAVALPLGDPAQALVVPGTLFGVALLMTPALYIFASLLDVAPGAGATLRALVRGLGRCGTLLLGLSPPLVFLAASTRSAAAAGVLGALMLAAGALAGLRGLWRDLFGERGETGLAHVLFAGWSLVSLGIGAQLLWQAQV